MKCKNCGSNHIVSIYAKCCDMAWSKFEWLDYSFEGYPPYVEGLSDGDSVNISVCLECSTLQTKILTSAATLEEDYV